MRKIAESLRNCPPRSYKSRCAGQGGVSCRPPHSTPPAQVAASTLSRGTAGDIVAPTFTNQICYTQDSASSWMRVDLLDNWVVPEAYVMAHQAVVGGKPVCALPGADQWWVGSSTSQLILWGASAGGGGGVGKRRWVSAVEVVMSV